VEWQRQISRLLLLLHLGLGVSAAVVFLAPGLVTLGLFLLIVPGLVMMILPTLFFYATILHVAWIAMWRRSGWGALATGVAACVFCGVVWPLELNRKGMAEFEKARAEIGGSRGAIERTESGNLGTVELVAARGGGGYCNDLCLTLLLNEDAERVVVGTGVYRVVRRERCEVPKQRLGGSLWVPSLDGDEMRRVAMSRLAAGECVEREARGNVVADVTVRWTERGAAASGIAWPLQPAPLRERGLAVEQRGARRYVRKVLVPGQYRVPLYLEPVPDGISFRGWRWGGDRQEMRAMPMVEWLEEGLGVAIRMPEPAGGSSLRQQMDELLSDASFGEQSVPMVLVPEYFRVLGKEGMESRDRERLGALVRDRRVKAFGELRQDVLKGAVAITVREAIVARLEVETTGFALRQLDDLAGRLPREVWRQNDARLDAVLANGERRLELPRLVYRLGERGVEGAGAQLLGYLREKDGQGVAVAAICGLGRRGESLLPELRAMALRGVVPKHLVEERNWASMLVALGVPVGELAVPKWVKDRGEFEKGVVQWAARGCGRE
jgi:hypothetical protein